MNVDLSPELEDLGESSGMIVMAVAQEYFFDAS